MYLTNLKIHGFKSFAQKTLLDFNGGLTCVVGPNGCGKSNIVDAIRWVLGEQRSAVLRSEKMDNVIFSGSKIAKPLGMAEVSMTIQNNRQVLPIEYSEVLVTRRLYRSGESEYLLNKTPCRLKDIRDLFLDTGVGPDTYSVIELKMVETILSNKSDERLGLFEEAAGINKYKHRRNAAFRKLDATNVDLNRVADILSEVERNVNSLKRQVSRAQRYQSLNHEIEEFEIRASSLEYNRLIKILNPLKSNLNNLDKNYQQNKTDLSREEAELERNRVALMGLEDSISKLQGKISALTDSTHQKENEVVATQERLRATEEKIVRYTEEQGQLEKRIEILKRRTEESEPQLGLMEEKVDALRMKHRLKEQELVEFEKILIRRRLDANESRTRLIELLELMNEKEKEKNRLESQLLHLEGRKEQLGEEVIRLSDSQKQSEIEKKELSKKEKKIENDFLESEKQLQVKQDLLQTAQQKTEKTKEEFLGFKNRLNTLNQQNAFFENLIEMNEGYPDGVQFILNESKSQPGVFGLLADLISVPKEYRIAVEAILGEKAFYVVVQSESDAFSLIDQLRERKLGQVTFLVLDRVQTNELLQLSKPKLEGVLAKANDVIQAKKVLKPIIDSLFNSYLFIRDAELFNQLPQKDNWLCATLCGEIFLPSGIFKSGRYEEEEKVSTVSRSAQLQEIQKQIEQLQKDFSVSENRLNNEVSKTISLKDEVKNWSQQVAKTREIFQQNRISSAQQQTSLTNLDHSLSSSKVELEKIESLIVEAAKQIQQLKPEIDDLIRKRRRYEDETELQQEKLEDLEAQRNQLAEDSHQLNVSLVQTTGDKNSLEADLKRMRRTFHELENTVVQRKTELEESKQNVKIFTETITTNQSELVELRKNKDVLLSTQSEKKEDYQTLQIDVNQKENFLKQTRKEGEASADVLQNIKLQISETEMKIQTLQSSMYEKYRIEITPIKEGSPDELVNIQNKVENLREKLHSFGAVNLLALDEFKKESERLEFLHRQKNDLVEAQDTLLETIQVINENAHDKFEDVFNQIRTNFRRNFESFFEGGEGDLQICFDADDPLSANIIILARPRGKQLGALELLSAGEKALTAITLLFSIYQVKPSPFCILDEVDAPLDDINVRRFLRVLKEFSDNTQFIIVTHNKITMESADFIYGVTMAEEGISKIVSVELSKATELVQSDN